jgi:hypothetical protein
MNIVTKIRGKKSALVRVKKSVLVHALGISTTVEESLQIRLFLQNEPNFRKVKLNVTKVLTKGYGQLDTWSIRKNKANSKPIQTQFKPNSNPIQTQYKAKQTQFQRENNAAYNN